MDDAEPVICIPFLNHLKLEPANCAAMGTDVLLHTVFPLGNVIVAVHCAYATMGNNALSSDRIMTILKIFLTETDNFLAFIANYFARYIIGAVVNGSQILSDLLLFDLFQSLLQLLVFFFQLDHVECQLLDLTQKNCIHVTQFMTFFLYDFR